MDWMAGQLEGRQEEEGRRRNNPRPQGVIRPGSGTDVLLRFLRQAPGHWFFHSELVLALGRSKGEIDWALLYLVRNGLVEGRLTELPARKPVLRYRFLENFSEKRYPYKISQRR
jgi:hypothetical protein